MPTRIFPFFDRPKENSRSCSVRLALVTPLGRVSVIDMCRTCFYAHSMSKMIQIRDVPESLHSTLKSRAAREGMSLSDFIKKELERVAERPTMREWLERTQQARPISVKRSAAQVIREMRDER